MSLVITGGVEAKIRNGDANANAAQDIACHPPDSTTPSLNCDFPGVTDTGTASLKGFVESRLCVVDTTSTTGAAQRCRA
jgi:hypothetical protein